MTGAIFCERRPATIIRSAWRGEGRKTSAPKRATSKRAAAMDIISMAQQARPKPSGQMELLRAQFTALRSEEHTSELQSHHDLVCRLLLEKKNTTNCATRKLA